MISFCGSDYVNLKNEKAFTFSMENTSFSNITGSGCFGFSGALNKSFNFKFIKGSIVDAENNLFYNYDRNEAFTLSGVVDQARYAYYVSTNRSVTIPSNYDKHFFDFVFVNFVAIEFLEGHSYPPDGPQTIPNNF